MQTPCLCNEYIVILENEWSQLFPLPGPGLLLGQVYFSSCSSKGSIRETESWWGVCWIYYRAETFCNLGSELSSPLKGTVLSSGTRTEASKASRWAEKLYAKWGRGIANRTLLFLHGGLIAAKPPTFRQIWRGAGASFPPPNPRNCPLAQPMLQSSQRKKSGGTTGAVGGCCPHRRGRPADCPWEQQPEPWAWLHFHLLESAHIFSPPIDLPRLQNHARKAVLRNITPV